MLFSFLKMRFFSSANKTYSGKERILNLGKKSSIRILWKEVYTFGSIQHNKILRAVFDKSSYYGIWY